MNIPDFKNTLQQCLILPEYARAEFLIAQQIQSGWSANIYFEFLLEFCDDCERELEAKAEIQNFKTRVLLPFKTNVSEVEILKKDDLAEITSEMVDQSIYMFRKAISEALEIAVDPVVVSSENRLDILEMVLELIRDEFKNQDILEIEEKGKRKSNSIYKYYLISDFPLFEYKIYRSIIRELLLNSQNHGNLNYILKSHYQLCCEIDMIWTSRLSLLFNERNKLKENISVEFKWIGFDNKTMEIVCENDFDFVDFKINQELTLSDLAKFNKNIFTLISKEVLRIDNTSTPNSNAQKSKISLSVIAMYHSYLKLPISKENQNAIAKSYGWLSGQKLTALYCRYYATKERICAEDTEKKTKNKINLIRKTIELLEDYPDAKKVAIDELQILEGKL